MFRIPTLVETGRYEATAYHFHATNDLGWAICTVNDKTGELLIMTDWTEPCGHRWPVQHLGAPSLTHFLAGRTHFDYLIGKLLPETRRRRFSPEKTVARFKEYVLEQRRRLEIEEHVAREVWDELSEMPMHDHVHDFVSYIPESYREHIEAHPEFERLAEEDSNETFALRSFILPALTKACEAEVLRRDMIAAHGPQHAPEIVPSRCTNNAPAGFTGHWREWHRGHGCDKDPDAKAAAS